MANLALPELDTKSVRDIVEENYEKAHLQTFATRMIYIGEHTLSKDELIKLFRKAVRDVNAGYCDITVRGIMIVYEGFYLHIIEGSEDTLHRLVRFTFAAETKWINETTSPEDETGVGLTVLLGEETEVKEKRIFKRSKLLMINECIKTLVFRGWRALVAKPPSLVGKLDVYWPKEQHMEQMHVCLDKITKLCTLAEDDKLSFEGLGAADPQMEALPEVALLDFLLGSPYILDFRSTIALHRRVDDFCFYFEEVWPLPTHFTPRLLYKLKIDDSFVEPLPVMPWERVKKEVTDDEQADQQSDEGSTDSSD